MSEEQKALLYAMRHTASWFALLDADDIGDYEFFRLRFEYLESQAYDLMGCELLDCPSCDPVIRQEIDASLVQHYLDRSFEYAENTDAE